VQLARTMGFNGVRKHQKIEDPRYLYWADSIGLVVWEEMPSAYRFTRTAVTRLTREWLEVLARDLNHPCIIAWVPFNESWGVPNLPDVPAQRSFVQALYHLTRTVDPTRPVVGNDGWLSTFAINPIDGSLTGVDSRECGHRPRWVAIEPTGRFLYVANTGGAGTGSALIKVFSINVNNGVPSESGAPDQPFVWNMRSGRRIGVGVTPLTKQLSEYFGVTSGVMINDVRADSPAAKAGLKAGDIIVEAEGKEVKSEMDIVRAIGEKKEGDVSLTIIRDRNRQTIQVTPEKMDGEFNFMFESPVAPGTPMAPKQFKFQTPITPFPMTEFRFPGRVL